jgi:hypothetical protein
MAVGHEYFDPSSIADLDEPVRRYLTHAISPGAPLAPGIRLRMRGRIKVGRWLAFTAEWEGDGRSFTWSARAGLGRFAPLRVVDRYRPDATACMDVRLLGRIPLVHADDEGTVRSGAGRAAVEAANWAPVALLPRHGVRWRAESADHIVASWELPPERPEVHLRIHADGSLRSTWVDRWDDGRHGNRGYVPCGGDVHAERRFDHVTLASLVTVGWWFGTPRYAPFFEAEILAAETVFGRGE